MQSEIESSKEIEDKCEEFNDADLQMSLSRSCYADLYVIRRLWVIALRTVLIGVKVCLIPTVEAAPPPEPKRPPKMKYTDLPMYDCPHFEYKKFEEDKEKCPNLKCKLMHNYLLPHVRACRADFFKSVDCARNELKDTYNEVSCDMQKAKNRFKAYMRQKDNMTLRQTIVALGAITGCYFGSGGGLPRKLFMSGLGICTAGALCFPKETDEGFRTFLYYSGKALLAIVNSTCGQNYALRERVPCSRDFPDLQPKLPSTCKK